MSEENVEVVRLPISLKEAIHPTALADLGVVEGAMTHGRAERIEFQRRWDAERGEFRNVPEAVFDLRDRLLMTGRVVGLGASSGASFEHETAYLLTIRPGMAVREQRVRHGGSQR